MIRYLKPLAFFASLALLASAAALPALRADDATPAPAAQTGTIKGTLVDSTGAAFTDAATVKLMTYTEHKHKKQAAGDKPQAIQTLKLTADDKGAYTFKDVAPGKYSVIAMSKEKQVGGHSTAPVVVEAGKDFTVDPITMAPKASKNK